MPTKRTYTDLNFNLERHPASQDVLRVYDLNAVKASIRHLILTEFYGRPFHPEIGSSVNTLLFENWSPLVDFAVKEAVKTTIANHEPRAEVKDVRTQFDDSSNTYRVEIDVYLYALMQETTIDFILQRAR